MAIPVSILILTKDEEARLGRCLAGLSSFDDIIVIDSHSTDKTAEIARQAGVQIVSFKWNGRYPKKKQWALEQVATKYRWVLFLDADECLSKALVEEITALFEDKVPPACAGYFIKGRYVADGKALRFGAQNNKLILLDKSCFTFPQLDDLDLPLGEVEGHYQPQLKEEDAHRAIGRLKAPLYHYALEDPSLWERNHRRYALWESGMNKRKAWPVDPVRGRELLKQVFRGLPVGRGVVAFFHSYLLKAGFCDGRAGWRFAVRRYRYYRMVERVNEQARSL